MNPSKDILARKPAESLTVDIKFRDGALASSRRIGPMKACLFNSTWTLRRECC